MKKNRVVLFLIIFAVICATVSCGVSPGSPEKQSTSLPMAQPEIKPAELYRDQNGYFATLPLVRQGLALDPNNADLKAMESRLQSKIKK